MSQPGSSGTGTGPSDDSSELESFRQQWREEVKAKTVPAGPAAGNRDAASGSRRGHAARPSAPPAPVSAPTPAPAPAQALAPAAVPALARARHRQPPQHAETQASQRSNGLVRVISDAPQNPTKLLSSGKKLLASEFDDDYAQPRAFDEIVDEYGRVLSRPGGAGSSAAAHAASASGPAGDGGDLEPEVKKEPQSALEHYEKAVEKEELGSLGDSLRHYRKAFRLDSTVDKKYKNKHFPAAPPAAAPPAPGKPVEEARADAAAEAAVVPAKPIREGPPPTLKELIMSFAGLAIEAAPPPVEGMPQPPCPLADLPDEILVHVLRDVAMDDVGDFVRLAQVCRKLAFLVATEDGIWGQVCVDSKFGFASMHRSWQRSISWGPVIDEKDQAYSLAGASTRPTKEERLQQQLAESLETTTLLRKGLTAAPDASSPSFSPVFPSWQRMFRLRPRIRFNGCYISTVNYIRAGQPSATLVTWNSPVHIVTYFRYLRFFRDGTVISLLTTAEPTDVIHFMTKSHLALHQGSAMPHLPSAIMQNAHRGRWRISGIPSLKDGEHAKDEGADGATAAQGSEDSGASSSADKGKGAAAAPALPFSSPAAAIEAESDLVVETEGVGKYYYRMELGFRTAGKGTRNNKLNWRGFYSYDRMTDDWGEFGLKNYRPFFFSRVRSYGTGE